MPSASPGFAERAAHAGRDVSAWTVADLEREPGWRSALDDDDRAALQAGLHAGLRPDKPLFDYTRADFPFGERVLAKLRGARDEAQHGRGIALVQGLPRDGLSAEQFEMLTWAIGLHLGVARPQDRLTKYINPVKDVGVDYRSPTGRGYSSRAELDFHCDGGDVVLLSCYNQAPVGGDSMVASAVAAWRQLVAERPELAEVLERPVAFSRQGEQTEGMAPYIMIPVFDRTDDDVVCMWNRNRIRNGALLPDAPQLDELQREAMERLDEILRRPELMYRMRLVPGDLQILSDFTALHSRTAFEDDPDPARKRTLYRLWLSTPNGIRLPASWTAFWDIETPGYVRGGSRGHHYDERCRAFEQRQAEDLGMHVLG